MPVRQGSFPAIGMTYIDGEGDDISQLLYRLQFKERDADLHAESQVNQLMSRQKQLLEEKLKRPDLSARERETLNADLFELQMYQRTAARNSVANQIAVANRRLCVSGAEQHVDMAMLNVYNGYTAANRLPADATVEACVAHEMVSSYNRAIGLQTPKMATGQSINQSESLGIGQYPGSVPAQSAVWGGAMNTQLKPRANPSAVLPVVAEEYKTSRRKGQ